jgi:glycine/D-amino acid oxidase-like deaminating enzyme
MELECDVLVIGGGCGGVAAALAASDLGKWVILTETGSWVGGQLTSQAVPPDEHPWVERTCITTRYRQLREAVRTRYKRTKRPIEKARRDPHFNPGAAWVSNLSAEPHVFREVLEDMLRPAQAGSLLRCLMRHRPVEAVLDGDQIGAVRFQDLQRGDQLTIRARYILEATEEGDFLPLARCESGGKCLGVTHVTNGCYRLHPVEWNIGEAAGALATFCLDRRDSPRAVHNSPAVLADFQHLLISLGVQLHWPPEIQTRVR